MFKENWKLILITILSVIILVLLFISKKSPPSEGYRSAFSPLERYQPKDNEEEMIEINPLESQKGPSFWDKIDEMEEDETEIPPIEFRPSEIKPLPPKPYDILAFFKEGGNWGNKRMNEEEEMILF